MRSYRRLLLGGVLIAIALPTLAGCFIDAMGVEVDDNGGHAGQAPATSTGGSTSSAPSGGSSGDGAAGGGTGGTTDVTSGGGGAGQGGEGGGGGSEPCQDRALAFDGDDAATLPYDASFDFDDDFAVGAWIRPEADPAKFVPGDETDARSRIISHMAPANADYAGYQLALSEANDDGMLHAFAAVLHTDADGQQHECNALSPTGVAPDSWTHVGFSYRQIQGDYDLRLYVDGVEVDRTDCFDAGLFSVSLEPGPLVLGNGAGVTARGYKGLIDDVALKNNADTQVDSPVSPAPIACGADYVAAFPFDANLDSVCASPALKVGLDASPADPQRVCTFP